MRDRAPPRAAGDPESAPDGDAPAEAARDRGRAPDSRGRGHALAQAMREATQSTWQAVRGLWPRRPRDGAFARPVRAGPPAASDGAPAGTFTEEHLAADASRRFLLYVPAFRGAGRAPLLVMLHGCRQDAREFADSTRMNDAAEELGVVVAYPEQSIAANVLRCWNWYADRDPSAMHGEGAAIAGMTRQVMGDHAIDPERVYIAGMSAGGTMAAVVARDHRDLYAALGVHSAVPAGFAHNVFSALRLMSRGPTRGQTDAAKADVGDPDQAIASIVFHGDRDRTVDASNADAIHASTAIAPTPWYRRSPRLSVQQPSAGRRGYTRSVEYGPRGEPSHELWIVHGAGHAWAGGSDRQRYSDASGPDASREMLRFFLRHPMAGGPARTAAVT